MEDDDMSKKELEKLLRDALCLLASTVITDDRILTDRQKRKRKKLLKAANRLGVKL